MEQFKPGEKVYFFNDGILTEGYIGDGVQQKSISRLAMVDPNGLAVNYEMNSQPFIKVVNQKHLFRNINEIQGREEGRPI